MATIRYRSDGRRTTRVQRVQSRRSPAPTAVKLCSRFFNRALTWRHRHAATSLVRRREPFTRCRHHSSRRSPQWSRRLGAAGARALGDSSAPSCASPSTKPSRLVERARRLRARSLWRRDRASREPKSMPGKRSVGPPDTGCRTPPGAAAWRKSSARSSRAAGRQHVAEPLRPSQSDPWTPSRRSRARWRRARHVTVVLKKS